MVLALARADAQRRGHGEATPLHIALGVLDEGGGVACSIIANARIPLDGLRAELEARLPPKALHRGASGTLPWSAAAGTVLDRAVIEAAEMGDAYVGTEHLLLALLYDPAGQPALAFKRWGFDRTAARAETVRVLGLV